MIKQVLSLLIFVPSLLFSQSSEDDDVVFWAAIDWLDRKLNYIYFDSEAQKWWLNRFYVNEQKEVTIKNIHTDKPQSANIKEKVYLIRKFKIEDINPFEITIRDIESNQGRIAKGKLLELRTVAHEKEIHKTVDGRRASNTSFVHISFPTFMTDSIAFYPDLVRGKLVEAIIASTKVYSVPDLEQNKSKIFEILRGKFVTATHEAFMARKKYANVVSFVSTPDVETYFGFTPADQLFYLSQISNEGVETRNYKLLPGEKLILQNIAQSSDVIEFETLNSFRMDGKLFYRN